MSASQNVSITECHGKFQSVGKDFGFQVHLLILQMVKLKPRGEKGLVYEAHPDSHQQMQT